MTGFNDPVVYNADLTYTGGVPPVVIDVVAATSVDASVALVQHFRRWADVAASTTAGAAVDVALTRRTEVAVSTDAGASVSLAVTRAAVVAAATTVDVSADLVLHPRHWAGVDAATTVGAATSLALAGHIGVTAAVTVGARVELGLIPAPPLTVTVAGADLVLVRGSLTVDQSIGSRSTARMTVLDNDGSLRFDRGQQVTVSARDVLLWSGYVDSAQRVRPGMEPGFLHQITCIDQQYLADKRIAAATFVPGTTCGAVVRALHADYLASEGVTLGVVEDGATLEQGALINYQPVSAALDALVDASDGYLWLIDQGRVLTFRHRSSVSAPWVVDNSTTIPDPRPAITSGNPDFRNVQWILGGLAVTDPQTETRTGDGDTQAWPMSYPLAKVPTVTLNGATQRVGIKGLEDDSTYDFGWNKGDPVISQASQATKLTVTDTLTVTYQGQYAIVARVDDPTGISDAAAVEGGTGIVEQAASPGNVNSAEQAFDLGRAKLDTYDRPGVKLEFDTYEAGLQAGQWVTVNLPQLGLDGAQMLIETVSGYDPGSGRLRWKVTAIDGPTSMPWQKVLGAPPELRKDDLVSVGSGTVVALVVSPRETTAWTETIEESPMTCPLLPYTLPVTLC